MEFSHGDQSWIVMQLSVSYTLISESSYFRELRISDHRQNTESSLLMSDYVMIFNTDHHHRRHDERFSA